MAERESLFPFLRRVLVWIECYRGLLFGRLFVGAYKVGGW